MTYDLEITIRNSRTQYFTGIASETSVGELVRLRLAPWGIPAPDLLAGPNVPTLAEQLAETGEYRRDEQDYRIIAKRST